MTTARHNTQPIIRIASGDPEPGQHPAVTVTLEAVDTHGRPLTAFYTQDGAVPDVASLPDSGYRTQ